MIQKVGEDNSRNHEPSELKYIQNLQKEEEGTYLLDAVERQVQGALGAVQRIAEMLETNKTVAPIEDLPEKIRAEYKIIKDCLDPERSADNTLQANGNRRSAGGIQVEANPLIKEMGGMPIENISAEWKDIAGDILDKTELENLINKKLKDRVDLANKLKNRLKAQPKLKPGQQLTPKFHKIQNTLKYILKEIPRPDAPAPRLAPSSAPRPRPGM